MSGVNRDNMQKWIDALRSGHYAQGHGALRTEEGFCCLGVACDISGLDKWLALTVRGMSWRYLGSTGVLPEPVVQWLGVDSQDPMITTGHDDQSLNISCAGANDALGLTLGQIADRLEARYMRGTES